MPGINQNGLVFQPIFNALVPDEGPKGIPITMNFAAVTEYDIDYQNMQQRGFISFLQSLWIDTSAAGGDTTIDIAVSGQQLIVPDNRQGYLTILVPNPPRINFTNSSGGVVKVILLNVPVTNILWAV